MKAAIGSYPPSCGSPFFRAFAKRLFLSALGVEIVFCGLDGPRAWHHCLSAELGLRFGFPSLCFGAVSGERQQAASCAGEVDNKTRYGTTPIATIRRASATLANPFETAAHLKGWAEFKPRLMLRGKSASEGLARQQQMAGDVNFVSCDVFGL